MTKTTPKAKADTKQSTPAAPLIVLGYDENHKPRAARFPATDAKLVTKAAQLRVVGSHRPRSQRRHVHVAVSRLPEAAKVCSPSDRNRVDEPSG